MASWVAPCSGVHIKRQFVNSPPLSLLGLPRTALANQYENGTILSFLSIGYQGVGAHCCWTRHHLDKSNVRHGNKNGALPCLTGGITMNASASGPSTPQSARDAPDALRHLTSSTMDERTRLEAVSVPSPRHPPHPSVTHPGAAHLSRFSLRSRFAASPVLSERSSEPG